MPSPRPSLRGAHIYDHLGVWSRRITDESAETLMPITSDIRVPGGVRAAPLGLAFEQGVATYLFAKVLAVPAQISLHIRDRADGVGDIRSVTGYVRAGRSLIVTDGDIRDRADEKRLIGYGSIIWSVIGAAPGVSDGPDRSGHTPTGVDIIDSVGIEPLADGRGVQLAGDLTPQILGPGGVLHAGIFQLLCEEAALLAGRAATGVDRMVAVDCTFDFLQPGKVGPFVAVAELIHAGDDGVDVRVNVRDKGNADRLGCASWIRVVAA